MLLLFIIGALWIFTLRNLSFHEEMSLTKGCLAISTVDDFRFSSPLSPVNLRCSSDCEITTPWMCFTYCDAHFHGTHIRNPRSKITVCDLSTVRLILLTLRSSSRLTCKVSLIFRGAGDFVTKIAHAVKNAIIKGSPPFLDFLKSIYFLPG